MTTRSLWLELTPRCNLDCAFCYNPWRPGTKAEHPERVSDEELRVAIDRLLRCADFSYVALSGGEPLLYPQLASLTGWLDDRGARTVLTTNGRLMTRRRLDELRDNGLDAVQVSLLGSTPELHDGLAGRQSWKQAVTALVLALDAGADVAATFIATRSNLDDLPRTVELLGRLGVRQMVVNELQPVGSARVNLGALAVDSERFDEVLAEAMPVAERWDVTIFPVLAHGRGPRSEAIWGRWSLSPDGKLKLCNHSTKTLGRVASWPQGRFKSFAADLQAGRLGPFRDAVDNCQCFTAALTHAS
ncbi:MAG TPA: radical SAM protein [Thermoleophilaceae bacterium]